MLAEHFLHVYSRKHAGAIELSPSAIDCLRAHRWPGNVRELQNVIERAVILCPAGGKIGPEHLNVARPTPVFVSAPVSKFPLDSAPAPSDGCGGKTCVFNNLLSAEKMPTLAEIELDLIIAALKRSRNNRTHAAKLIGISLRTLRNKLSDYRKVLGGPIPEIDDSSADSGELLAA